MYDVSQNAMKVLTQSQVKALASLDNWNADKIVVHTDFTVESPDTQHGTGTFVSALVYRNREHNGNEPVIVIGIAPNGDMHS